MPVSGDLRPASGHIALFAAIRLKGKVLLSRSNDPLTQIHRITVQNTLQSLGVQQNLGIP